MLAGALLSLTLVLPVGASAQSSNAATEPDLGVIKQYVVDNTAKLTAGTAEVLDFAQWYYDLAAAASFDYAALWEQHGAEIAPRLEEARRAWVEDASANYELSEGIVAGVPALSYFDVLLDAGVSGEEDPTAALDVSIELPNGEKLERPGSYFHHVTEPALWGTRDAWIGLAVDLNGDGTVAFTEALPEANVLLGGTRALDDGAHQLQDAVAAWEPTLSDTFTALVVMIPTLEGYFGEWKASSFVLGDAAEEESFVGNSRLVDIVGIFNGLNLTYAQLQGLVATVDPVLAEQIGVNLEQLTTFVQDLLDQETSGTRFTPEQADLFGATLQEQAATTAGQVTQAAALLNIPVDVA
jgi:hypothetical protein